MYRPLLIAALAATLSLPISAHAGSYPEKPIRIIVPTNAGGSMDSIGRIFQRTFEEKKIIPQKTVIVNLAGAGGTIGTRKIKESEPDGYTIGFWHDGIITSKAMGVVDYDHTAFEIIGISGYSELGLGIRKDSPYTTLEKTIAKLKAEPRSIKIATNIGLPVHFNPLIIFDEAGVDALMVQTGGGAKRLASILGGHTNAAVFSVPEFVKFKKSGLEPMVVFSDKRNNLLPDIGTAKEAGINFSTQSNRIWIAPKGTPKDVIAYLSNAIKTAMDDPGVKEEFASLGVNPQFKGPAETEKSLKAYLQKVLPMVAKARTLKK